MNSEYIWSLIINVITLLAVLITWVFQREKIKSLDTSLKSQQVILDAVKTYFNIFKIDEVKKFVALSEENYRKESDKKAQNIVDSMTQEMTKQREQVLQTLEASTKTIAQFYGFAYSLLLRIPPRMRSQLVTEHLKNPDFAALIIKSLKDAEDIYLPLQISMLEQLGLGAGEKDSTK